MIALVMLIVVAAALIVVTVLCAHGTISSNSWAGIRIPSTRASDEAWRAGHRAAVVPVGVGGVIVIAVGIAGIVDGRFTAMAVGVVAGILLVTVVVTVLRAHHAASRVSR